MAHTVGKEEANSRTFLISSTGEQSISQAVFPKWEPPPSPPAGSKTPDYRTECSEDKRPSSLLGPEGKMCQVRKSPISRHPLSDLLVPGKRAEMSGVWAVGLDQIPKSSSAAPMEEVWTRLFEVPLPQCSRMVRPTHTWEGSVVWNKE